MIHSYPFIAVVLNLYCLVFMVFYDKWNKANNNVESVKREKYWNGKKSINQRGKSRSNFSEKFSQLYVFCLCFSLSSISFIHIFWVWKKEKKKSILALNMIHKRKTHSNKENKIMSSNNVKGRRESQCKNSKKLFPLSTHAFSHRYILQNFTPFFHCVINC